MMTMKLLPLWPVVGLFLWTIVMIAVLTPRGNLQSQFLFRIVPALLLGWFTLVVSGVL